MGTTCQDPLFQVLRFDHYTTYRSVYRRLFMLWLFARFDHTLRGRDARECGAFLPIGRLEIVHALFFSVRCPIMLYVEAEAKIGRPACRLW